MKTLQGIKFTHWLGMHITPRQALLLEKFKFNNKCLLDAWKTRYPALRNIPPIYWDQQRRSWKWSDVETTDIRKYVSICEAVLLAKRLDDN